MVPTVLIARDWLSRCRIRGISVLAISHVDNLAGSLGIVRLVAADNTVITTDSAAVAADRQWIEHWCIPTQRLQVLVVAPVRIIHVHFNEGCHHTCRYGTVICFLAAGSKILNSTVPYYRTVIDKAIAYGGGGAGSDATYEIQYPTVPSYHIWKVAQNVISSGLFR